MFDVLYSKGEYWIINDSGTCYGPYFNAAAAEEVKNDMNLLVQQEQFDMECNLR